MRQTHHGSASSGGMGKSQMGSGDALVENGSCAVFSWPAVTALSWPWKHKNEAAPLLHAAPGGW